VNGSDVPVGVNTVVEVTYGSVVPEPCTGSVVLVDRMTVVPATREVDVPEYTEVVVSCGCVVLVVVSLLLNVVLTCGIVVGADVVDELGGVVSGVVVDVLGTVVSCAVLVVVHSQFVVLVGTDTLVVVQ
jgi:hypothetical protein